MINDEELKTYNDYNEGQVMAASRILIELVGLFNEYKEELRIIGGWVPELMFPGKGHTGSIDVDVLVNHKKLKEAGYMSMERILLKNGYSKHLKKYFSYTKAVIIEGISYEVDVDILSGKYNGTPDDKRSQHVQGFKAVKASGGDYAFIFPPQSIRIKGERPDGAKDSAVINVVAVVPFIVMKTMAMGRGKAKDAYDIYFIIKHYEGGIKALAEEFKVVNEHEIIINMKKKLAEKFASVNHAGAKDVSDFLDTKGEESELIRRDVYEQVKALLEII